MSNVVFISSDMRWGGARSGVQVHDGLARGRVAGGKNYPVAGGMIETAENLRREYRISRQEQDELAVLSHQRARAPRQTGCWSARSSRSRSPAVRFPGDLGRREHPRADTTVESLSTLRPIMGRQDPDATVTAGNASGQNDAASMCIVTTPEKAAELGLRPLVRLVSWGVAGVEPKIMGIGPVPATAAALGRAGLELSDIDLIELNEAFAAQTVGVDRWNGLRRRTSTAPTCSGPGSHSATRSAPPVAGCSPRWRGRCSLVARGTDWRRCASAVSRGSGRRLRTSWGLTWQRSHRHSG